MLGKNSIHGTMPPNHECRCIIADAPMKARRQSVILELIDREPLHSQEQLRRLLHRQGLKATQATISRDIKDLGLVKRAGDGAYRRPGADDASPQTVLGALEHAAAEFLRKVDRVRSRRRAHRAGQSQPLAVAIDRARLPKSSAPSPATTHPVIARSDPESR